MDGLRKWLQGLSPAERWLLLAGVPLVGIAAVVSTMRGRDGQDQDQDGEARRSTLMPPVVVAPPAPQGQRAPSGEESVSDALTPIMDQLGAVADQLGRQAQQASEAASSAAGQAKSAAERAAEAAEQAAEQAAGVADDAQQAVDEAAEQAQVQLSSTIEERLAHIAKSDPAEAARKRRAAERAAEVRRERRERARREGAAGGMSDKEARIIREGRVPSTPQQSRERKKRAKLNIQRSLLEKHESGRIKLPDWQLRKIRRNVG